MIRPQSHTKTLAADHDRYVRMFGMSPQPDQPIHWDKHRGKLNLTLVLGLLIAGFGIITTSPVPLIAGLAAAGYSWLTTAKYYYIYRDALIIVYGRPRVKVLAFGRVSHVELLSLPMGDRLRVQLVDSRPVLLAAQDSETFREHLDTALEEFRSAHPEQEMGDGPQQAEPPY